MSMRSKRPIVLASAAAILVIALLLTADAVARTRVQHALAASAACALGAKATDVRASVTGFPVLYQLAVGQLDDVRVTADTRGARLALDLHGVSTRGGHDVKRIDASATVPFSTAGAAAGGGSGSAPAPRLADVDGRLEAVVQHGSGSIGITYALGHTATTLTFTPQSLVIGGLTVPASAVRHLAQPAARQLTEARTVTPKLPAGVAIRAAGYSTGGLKLALKVHGAATGTGGKALAGGSCG